MKASPLCEHVEVEGDGHHFFAVIVSSEFEGKARLARPPSDQRRFEGATGQQRIARAVDFRCRHACGMGGEAAISRYLRQKGRLKPESEFQTTFLILHNVELPLNKHQECRQIRVLLLMPPLRVFRPCRRRRRRCRRALPLPAIREHRHPNRYRSA